MFIFTNLNSFIGVLPLVSHPMSKRSVHLYIFPKIPVFEMCLFAASTSFEFPTLYFQVKCIAFNNTLPYFVYCTQQKI